MSTPLLPLAVWAPGTNQNSIPANDNALRIEALSREIISQAITAQPGSPADGDTYIIAATHTGSQWATFSPLDIAIFRSGTWYAWAPTEGLVVNVAGSEYKFDSGAWTAITGGLTNPMTAVGDIITGGSSGAPQRLAASTNGYVLTLASGAPAWAAVPAGFSNPMTTAGDLILGGVAGAAGRLGIGSNGYVLTVTAGVVGWSASFTNPMTTVGDLIVGGVAGAAGRIAAGTATYVLTSNGAGVAPTWQAAGGGGGGLTGFTSALNTSSPNNTVNASSVIASGGSSNQDAVFGPKAQGSVLAQIPDGTATGGNKRAVNTVDLQMVRASADQIAGANYSFIIAGTNNKVIVTLGNNGGWAGGDSNIASGVGSVGIGGTNNKLTGNYTFSAGGGYGHDEGTTNSSVFGYGSSLPGVGNNHQRQIFHQRKDSTSATAVTLSANAAATSATASIKIGTYQCRSFRAHIIAYGKDSTNDCATWDVKGMVTCYGGTPVFVGTTVVTQVAATAGAVSLGWTVAAILTSSTYLEFQCTGSASKTVRWSAVIETVRTDT